MNLKKPRKKRIPKHFPCRCGHSKAFHDTVGAPLWTGWCEGFTQAANNKYGRTYNCDCEKFVPDNLKYLEQCEQKKGQGE
jgi:hypothetical protein